MGAHRLGDISIVSLYSTGLCVCVTSRLLGVIPTLNCLAVVDYTMRECLAGRLYSAAQLISV